MLSRLKRTTAFLAALMVVFSCVWCAVFVQGTASAEASYKAVLFDLDGCIPDGNEAALLEYMQRTADSIECNIGVVITSDLNGQTDTQYSEGFLNDVFGRGSSSVVLMLLNTYDNPAYANYYDKLSLDGRGYDYYDSKADRIFKSVYDGLDSSGFEEAVRDFCDALVKYKGSGGSYGGSTKYEFKDMMTVTLGAMLFGLVLSLIVTSSVSSKYTRKAPVSAASYLDRNRTAVTKKTDVFVREYTRTYTNSSGSHGGGGGHSSHSGGHRSGGHSSHSGRHR